MDETLDEPPTSAVFLDSYHFSQVIFNNVEKFYVPGGDITCCYTLTQNITPRRKDWVGIFRVGWKTTREYYTFMWAPLPSDLSSDSVVNQQINFRAYYLPKDDEYYQFCYVDQEGMVRGASVPFQFRAETEDDILVVTTQGEVEEIEQQNKDLLKENKELKENCLCLQKQNLGLQEQLQLAQEKMKELEGEVCFLQTGNLELRRAQELQAGEMSSAQMNLAAVREENEKLGKENQELQKGLESLRSSCEKLELEANFLKEGNKQLMEQDGCRERELQQLKERNQEVSSEKEQLESRLKTTLDHMDLLQHQTQDLTKELEEKNHLFQILQWKKDETDEENLRLRQKNNELLMSLAESPDYSARVAVPPARVPAQAPGSATLVFGNPYFESPETSAENMPSVKKCHLCGEVFPDDMGPHQYEDHLRSHLLNCPYCDETFEESNRQVYNDHMYCHSLE
ncbi:calcium-binding and coiled-coil domain-containing protein 2 [Pelodiscus sinensis]|uniref:calcium-binding and coiled-coil domain-containing protein 2 n=1 Tax=Pelodiscus sinensis TaxID=13735 RepID=UPI003F6CF549